MNRIRVHMAPGEGSREQDLRIALSHDPRFEPLKIDSNMPVDLKFCINIPCEEDFCGSGLVQNALHVELKEPQDFVQSVLSGHLMEQVLSIRESGCTGCVVILGGLDDLYGAVKDASQMRAGKHMRGDELKHAIATTHSRCKSFRKRSFLQGVPVFHQEDDSGFFDGPDQWKDILELAHDYLLDGDMLGFRQRPAENEREVTAASMMFRGIGSDSMRALLKEYTLAFVPRGIYAKPIEEIPGFGKKRCQMITSRVRMVYR